MAAIMRPQMLRQTCAAAAGTRFISSAALASSRAAWQTPLVQQCKPQSIVAKTARSAFVRERLPTVSKVAAFHTSRKNQLLPPPAQRITGGVNDPAPVLPADPVHGNYHWDFERIIAVSLIPLTIAPFASGSLNPLLDATFCGLIVIHSHFGFESCITDYFPKWRVPNTQRALKWVLNGFTLLVAYGLYEFETNDVGVTEAVTRVWKA
ncbi:succinate dehydrogenase membrane anchor subunit [Eremomyces bilateralis CBS 781.70]|uniref:Succinate dehydrogenase [ubiquinone] cytochrome b small subunit n=1 Tax=Eremomyces bilateralis CBS 781.70 TaxID=1392243 RepID=A0A6G1FRB5_9PEZI|nr:succinate dehydrogenase membrane anchor subunit [Eremomyces bilateralis CBS 781.70]KAF1808334.1 succinate dehydrogenase membrane anchor subunit [Eremomyces bilateralis CBS 781.70]